MPKVAERKLIVAREWVEARAPKLDMKFYDGTHIYAPAHDIDQR